MTRCSARSAPAGVAPPLASEIPLSTWTPRGGPPRAPRARARGRQASWRPHPDYLPRSRPLRGLWFPESSPPLRPASGRSSRRLRRDAPSAQSLIKGSLQRRRMVGDTPARPGAASPRRLHVETCYPPRLTRAAPRRPRRLSAVAGCRPPLADRPSRLADDVGVNRAIVAPPASDALVLFAASRCPLRRRVGGVWLRASSARRSWPCAPPSALPRTAS